MAVIAGRLIGRAVIDDIGLVPFPIDGRVDTFEGKPDGVRPGAGRIVCCDDEVATAFNAGVDDVEAAVVPADVRGEDGLRDAPAGKVELAGAVDCVGDLGPVHKVFRRENRQTRKMRKGTVDEIIVVADPRHRRIRIVTGQYGIAKFALLRRDAFIRLATVAKLVEPRWGGRKGARYTQQERCT